MVKVDGKWDVHRSKLVNLLNIRISIFYHLILKIKKKKKRTKSSWKEIQDASKPNVIKALSSTGNKKKIGIMGLATRKGRNDRQVENKQKNLWNIFWSHLKNIVLFLLFNCYVVGEAVVLFFIKCLKQKTSCTNNNKNNLLVCKFFLWRKKNSNIFK